MVGASFFAIFHWFMAGSPGPLYPKRSSPWSLLVIESIYGFLDLLDCAEIHKQVVMVSWFKALDRVWGKQLADILTRLMVNKERKKKARNIRES